MNEQDLVRDRLNQYLKDSGIKAKFLASKLGGGINESIFCRFRKGERELYPEHLRAIKDYLDGLM